MTAAWLLGRKTRCERGNLAKSLRRHFGKNYDEKEVRNSHVSGNAEHVEVNRSLGESETFAGLVDRDMADAWDFSKVNQRGTEVVELETVLASGSLQVIK
jgi:hypothetical protein